MFDNDAAKSLRQIVATYFNALQSRSSPVHEPVFKHLVQGVLALLTSENEQARDNYVICDNCDDRPWSHLTKHCRAWHELFKRQRQRNAAWQKVQRLPLPDFTMLTLSFLF